METSGAPTTTILAIDDDPDIRAALRIVLEAEGFSVGEAANGEEGLKAAERINPDVIVVDLMMEEVDSGVTVAKKLRERGYEGPIYILSSAGDTVRYNLEQGDDLEDVRHSVAQLAYGRTHTPRQTMFVIVARMR